MLTATTVDLPMVEKPIEKWWASGQVDDFRWEFFDRFREQVPADHRMGKLVALHHLLTGAGLEPHDGYLSIEAVSDPRPLGFLQAGIREKLGSVLRSDRSGNTAAQARAVLTADEQRNLAEFYSTVEELAAHYLTEFAPTQSDLIAPYPFLDNVALAEALFLPFRQVVGDVLGGRLPLRAV